MEIETANWTKWGYRGACSNQRDKTPEEKLSEVEIGELPDRVQDHKYERTPEKNGWTQKFNKELEDTKKNQTDNIT